MAEESQLQNPNPNPKTPSTPLTSISLNIWPPSTRTREAVTKRLIETLSSPSTLSDRYGTIPLEDAVSVAGEIEKDAFGFADEKFVPDEKGSESIDGGLETLGIYSKEISRRMIEFVKARNNPKSKDDDGGDGSRGGENVETEASASA